MGVIVLVHFRDRVNFEASTFLASKSYQNRH